MVVLLGAADAAREAHRHGAGGEHRLDAVLAPVAVRVLDDRAAQLERTDEAPRQEQEMRHDLAREAALGAPVEPGGGVGLPRPRPAREGDLDPDRPRLADRASVIQVPIWSTAKEETKGKFTAARAPSAPAASTRRFASAMSTASGFSQNTARSRSSTRRTWPRWVAGGEAM